TYKNVVPRLPHANDASSFWLCCGGEPPTADRTRSHPVPASTETGDLLASCPPDLVGTRIAKLHTGAHRGLQLEVADSARPAGRLKRPETAPGCPTLRPELGNVVCID